jgi:quercetin dioxygenase-like cupin family protein
MTAYANPTVVTSDELRTGGSTVKFIGDDHSSGSSFYISRDAPGEGPDLHTHPYTETFVVHEGTVRFTVGDQVVDAQGGDIVVVPADTPHGFTNVGERRMLSVNIHASATMIQTDLGSKRRDDGSYELIAE